MRRYATTLSQAIGFLGIFAAAGSLRAQSTSVINFATINASQAADGLGFQIQGGQDWQWAAVAAAGGTHARISCSWSVVEQQTPPPNNRQASPAYKEDPSCEAGFASAKRYGIKPTVIAGFSAPYHQILTVTIPEGAPAGAKSFNIQFSSGVGGDTLANIQYPNDYICPMMVGSQGRCASEMTWRFSPQGSLIAGVKLIDSQHATVTLAASLKAAIPADSTPYMITEILYPSTASNSPNDPSVVAYSNYVSFLAQDIADHGLQGDIEIWNEPPWVNDPWDFRPYYFDSGTWTGGGQSGANFGFAANIQHRTFPPGVTATWNGTSGSGSASLLGPLMLQWSGEKLVQPSTTITKESFHPYAGGDSVPETVVMSPDCLEAAAKSTDSWGKNIYGSGRDCYLPGIPQGANVPQAIEWDDMAKLVNPSYGIGHSVTETNNLPPAAGMQVAQARSNVRQFLSFEGMGLTPVEFFEMWNGSNGSDPSFSFVDSANGSFTPRPSFTALAGMMADIKSISNPPVTAANAANLSSVTSFNGTYPLLAMHLVGARDGVNANSDALMVWQVSSCTTPSCWYYLNVTPGTASVSVPAGMKVTAVRDLVTQTDLAYKTSGQQITFAVADNPVEIMTDPSSYAGGESSQGLLQPTKLAIAANPATSTFGKQVVLTAALSPSSTKSSTSDGQAVSLYDGGSLLATPALKGGLVSFDLTSLSAGTHTLRAVYAGDKNFGGSSTTMSYTVTAAPTTLTLDPIADQTYGTSSVPFNVKSSSPMQINYTVVSGPARVAAQTATGVSIQIFDVGTIVLQASQTATASYAAQSGKVSFTVKPADAKIYFNGITPQTFGNGPFNVSAYSASHGAITYSIASGPASISGARVTITGAGNVVVKATQAATKEFLEGEGTLVIPVKAATAQLTISNIAAQTFGGAPVSVSSTSASPATVSYAVVSGPASVSGRTITYNSAGTVVIRASQPASANYGATTAQTSFVVRPAAAKLALNSISAQLFGQNRLQVQPTSLSTGAITYSVVNGHAHMVGTTIVPDAPGYTVVRATQAASGNYQAAMAQTGFWINPGPSNLTFQRVPDQSGLTSPFAVHATSKSTAAITYKVVSGPATITSQNEVTVNGFGTVVLQANQAATVGYTAATTNTSFMVVPTSADLQ